MSAHNFGRVYLLALMIVVVGGIGGCDTDELASNLGAVHGAIVDANGDPISSTLVTVGQSGYSALTNGDGRYVLNLPVGEYSLTATKEGFKTITLPVDVSSSETYRQLNFTLAKSGQEKIKVELAASKERYEASDVIELKLRVTNNGEDTIELLSKGFFAQDGMGNVVWRFNHDLNVSLEKGESKTYSGRWEWYTAANESPVILGSTINLYGLFRIKEGEPEVVSAPCKALLIGPKPTPETIDFENLANGLDSSFRERRGLVIRSASEWAHFWESHQRNVDLPAVDFSKNLVIAAMGGGTTAVNPRVVITKLERLVPYRTVTGEFAPTGPCICSIDQYFCTDVTTGSDGNGNTENINAPYHIVIAPIFRDDVEFRWNVLRMMTDL